MRSLLVEVGDNWAAINMLHLASGLRQQARATVRRCNTSSSLPLSLQRSATMSVGAGAESGSESARSTLAAGIDINVNQKNVHVQCGSDTLDGTLLHFLRRRGDTDVKAVCAEGGCGACTVILSEWSNADQAVVHKSVCACLTPLASMDQKQVRLTLRPRKTAVSTTLPRYAFAPSAFAGSPISLWLVL